MAAAGGVAAGAEAGAGAAPKALLEPNALEPNAPPVLLPSKENFGAAGAVELLGCGAEKEKLEEEEPAGAKLNVVDGAAGPLGGAGAGAGAEPNVNAGAGAELLRAANGFEAVEAPKRGAFCWFSGGQREGRLHTELADLTGASGAAAGAVRAAARLGMPRILGERAMSARGRTRS